MVSSSPDCKESEFPQVELQLEDDKRRLYSHPLFPLLALLFEKCEIATQSQDLTCTESFALDLQAFVQHQQQKGTKLVLGEPEVDNLMIWAIQVLRIHLLELEKVQELCKDFCNRYISCLKTKLHSENLLRTEYFCDSDSSPSPNPGDIYGDKIDSLNNESNSCPSMSPICAYQDNIEKCDNVDDCLGPLSDNKAQPKPMETTSNIISITDNNTKCSAKKKQKRGILPKHATMVMRGWLFQHIVHPYPTEEEKKQLAAQADLTLIQVNNWFINARRRILQPMLDTTDPCVKVKASKQFLHSQTIPELHNVLASSEDDHTSDDDQ